MIIALFPNEHKKSSFELAANIRSFLEERGVIVVAEDEKAELIGASALSSIDPEQIQCLISMGGDGTILRLSNHYGHLKAPILGINLGHLGFMAEVPVSDIYPSLTDLLQGFYSIEERLVIEGKGSKGESLRAVNEIVFHRAHNYRLIELAVHVDGKYVNTFVADGIILATPNGSTAYSLAAGGPILCPSLEAFVMTPISPHAISNRPIVLPSNHTITIQYLSNYEPIEVRADGLDVLHIKKNESFSIQRSKETFKLVHLHRHDYFATLRSKLHWSGKLR